MTHVIDWLIDWFDHFLLAWILNTVSRKMPYFLPTMKIKHVATLLIPLTLLGLWSSYRLFLVYLAGESGQVENNSPTALRSSTLSTSLSASVLDMTNNTSAKATATTPTLNKNENQITAKPHIITRMPPPKSDTNPNPAETKPSQPPKPNTYEHNYKHTSKPYNISEEPAAGESLFSACLKWMDDYRQLGEWLAYHYHVLPLRYLVFFRDPKSTSDPQPIFDRWADRIQVEYWTNNSDFMTKDQQKTIDNMSIDTKKHRRAQRFFYDSWIKHLHEKNRTWAILIAIRMNIQFSTRTTYQTSTLINYKNQEPPWMSFAKSMPKIHPLFPRAKLLKSGLRIVPSWPERNTLPLKAPRLWWQITKSQLGLIRIDDS